MQNIGTKIRKSLQKLAPPEVITGAASGILAALVWEGIGEIAQSSLNHQIVGFYLMALIALVCLIIVGYFMIRIEKLVEKRNYTRFITSKIGRLNLMTDCIKNAKRSIYILSDLSDTKETRLQEHKGYLEALEQVMIAQKGNSSFNVIRIVAPKSTQDNRDWVFTSSSTEKYIDHFIDMWEFKLYSLRHTNIPCNVSLILIDNKHLFWKPELSYDDETLQRKLDGGLYLEDYTQEGVREFAELFEEMYAKTDWSDPGKFESPKVKMWLEEHRNESR